MESEEDVANLSINREKIIVTNQTTMSQWDVADIMVKVQEKYPHVEQHKEICLATQVRQEAVAEQAGQADVTIVVGDQKVITLIDLLKYPKRLPGHLPIESLI